MNDIEDLKKAAWEPVGYETADQIFLRPLSIRITNLLLYRSIRPTHITLLSFAVLVVGASLFLYGEYLSTLVAAIAVLVSDVLDCTDGELARAKKQETETGALIDYFVDRVGDMVVYSCITYVLFTRSSDERVLMLGIFVIVSNSFMTDIGQKVNSLKEQARIRQRSHGVRSYLNYGGSANTLILLAASAFNMLFEGMILIGILCFSYAIARFIEGHQILGKEARK